MGKKGRKTRWRTLTITDERSDSEESNTTASEHRVPKGYPQKSYYGRFTYSSQSTPTRRFQGDGTKSTRSSSTASENKITFNEDEYTRITTPRQDVLFKKGYLNKPKTYQTQTSTGNSTTSTGNSTGNGTPDHQSTDLEYESQFVFPNGFVDQNGIYYVNSFEPYPVMVYNPPTYYPEFTNVKTKRCSTGSLTESTSPNNEETSQDLSQGENPNPVYNVVYPGFYYNGACQAQDAASPPEPRRVKKRRRRKPSRSRSAQGSTSESSDEVFDDEEPAPEDSKDSKDPKPEEKQDEEGESAKSKYDLKPDAEEFVPRAYRHPETIPLEANVQFIKIPSNFVPVPILNPMGDFNAFIPPGIPINFIPQNYINFVPYKPPHVVDKQDEPEAKPETPDVPKNHIDIAKIVSKLEEAAKEQDAPKDETSGKGVARKRQRYQKVELRKPPPSPEPREWKKPQESPKREAPKVLRNYSDTLKRPPLRPPEAARKDPPRNKIEPPVVTKAPNEWIAVASRKKRKNKNVEEAEDFEEKVEPEAPPVLEAPLEVEVVVEAPPRLPPPQPETKPEVAEVPETKEEVPEVTETKEVVEVAETKEEKKVTKKKSKKSHAKATTPPQPTRRVMIKDVDLSMEVEEPKIVEEVPPVPVEVLEVPTEPVEEEVTVAEPVDKRETPEKKAKKKKKKVKVAILSSQSSSNTTLNVTDDSYDFLLDESLEKTNVEVSQELDKMIQRGMYSSLEEKIKSLNMESNDAFFKTIINNLSSRESSVEKSPYIKSPDLSKLLAAPLLKPKPGLDEPKPDFLDEATPNSPVGGDLPRNENLYPITKAVKEWMTKTRENTPDVELLKSPSTIFREFGDEGAPDPATRDARKTSSSSVEEGEDVLAGYEEAEKKAYPKHGNLPYRAICCSIM